MYTLPSRIEDHARNQPDAVFCTFLCGSTVEEITFADLFRRSLAYTAAYRKAGIGRGDLVLVVLKHTPHLFYSYLGALFAGAIPSFMPFPSPKQRADLYWADHQALFDRIDPALIVTYEENLQSARKLIADFGVPGIVASDEILNRYANAAVPSNLPAADDIACLQHSSGTTNLKKGVMLTHRAIIDQVDAYSKAIGFTRSDSIASWLPLYHDMGFIACFMASIVQGTHLVALDPFEWVMRPQLLLAAIEKYRATFSWLPNFAFGHLANTARPQARWDLSSIRAFVNCSEPCKPATFKKFIDRFGPSGIGFEHLQVCYALAENVFAVTQTALGRRVRSLELQAEAFSNNRVVATRAEDASASLLSCGQPIEGVRVEIRDGDSRPLPTAEIGEVFIQSPFLFNGYYKLPEKTREKLHGGWYATGDMGFILDDELFVTGRVDDLLIIAGRNYYAHEIEAVVNEVPSLIPGRNIALAIEDALTDAMAVVVLAECEEHADLQLVGKAVRREVLERIGLAVREVVPLPSGGLIKTTSGKISRSKNLKLYRERLFDVVREVR